MELDRDLRSRQEVRTLVAQAHRAQEHLARLDQAAIDRIVQAMAEAGARDAAELGQLAAGETGFGNAEDKREKNLLASRTLW